ncbi:nodulation protein NodH [Pontivivens ytuae]|uniref:Nodulation protein NodH n=1 Tax=Pontivivens ytuae TaxID=2789856 RepID=A0A7S9QEV8_9RHOB|nr:nodulation protein NodH [Pontivivens ytuae]QPH55852.1 nodulation protein NodH [Pontivivens ytuae]
MPRPDRFRFFTIFGVMRTGSNLLQRTLDQFPDLLCHGELFNPAFIGRVKDDEAFGFTIARRDADPDGLIDAVVADSPETLVGFRLFDGHDPRVEQGVLARPDAGKIILTRDPLDSYISLKIARETDQWMLGKTRARRSARVRFDMDEFRDYRSRTADYYARVERTLQLSGEAAFRVRFDDVTDLEVVNGLAKWLGSAHQLDSIEETIQRQNPGPIEEKVLNFEEMEDALRSDGGVHQTGGSSGQRAANLRFMRQSKTLPLLYAAIPGTRSDKVLRWIHGIDGGDDTRADIRDGALFGQPQNRRALQDWLGVHADTLCFTTVAHPLARAHDAFLSRILDTQDEGYPRIRSHAESEYGMHVPDAESIAGADRARLTAMGYDVEAHRRAFAAFLDFVRANLAGRTPMRIDGLWAPQHDFVEGFGTAVTLGLILREDDLLSGAAYIKRRFGLDRVRNAALKEAPSGLFDLSEIWTQELEDAARAIYPRDFAQFGFGPAGQAA